MYDAFQFNNNLRYGLSMNEIFITSAFVIVCKMTFNHLNVNIIRFYSLFMLHASHFTICFFIRKYAHLHFLSKWFYSNIHFLKGKRNSRDYLHTSIINH